jgi:hypothetical protein
MKKGVANESWRQDRLDALLKIAQEVFKETKLTVRDIG